MKTLLILLFYCSITDWIVAVTAIVGLIFAIVQLLSFKKSRAADFIYRLKRDFFIEKTQAIIFFIDEDILSFQTSSDDPDYVYFQIDKEKLKSLPGVQSIKQYAKKNEYTISAFEIDDLILGHFEDLGLFKKKKIISIEFIYESFDWYIQLVHENCAIQKYITWQRKQENSEDVYTGFDYITSECKKYEGGKG